MYSLNARDHWDYQLLSPPFLMTSITKQMSPNGRGGLWWWCDWNFTGFRVILVSTATSVISFYSKIQNGLTFRYWRNQVMLEYSLSHRSSFRFITFHFGSMQQNKASFRESALTCQLIWYRHRYLSLGHGLCAPFPSVPRSTQRSTLCGTVNEYQLSGWVIIINGDGDYRR